jgi:hypothetical protein
MLSTTSLCCGGYTHVDAPGHILIGTRVTNTLVVGITKRKIAFGTLCGCGLVTYSIKHFAIIVTKTSSLSAPPLDFCLGNGGMTSETRFSH